MSTIFSFETLTNKDLVPQASLLSFKDIKNYQIKILDLLKNIKDEITVKSFPYPDNTWGNKRIITGDKTFKNKLSETEYTIVNLPSATVLSETLKNLETKLYETIVLKDDSSGKEKKVTHPGLYTLYSDLYNNISSINLDEKLDVDVIKRSALKKLYNIKIDCEVPNTGYLAYFTKGVLGIDKDKTVPENESWYTILTEYQDKVQKVSDFFNRIAKVEQNMAECQYIFAKYSDKKIKLYMDSGSFTLYCKLSSEIYDTSTIYYKNKEKYYLPGDNYIFIDTSKECRLSEQPPFSEEDKKDLYEVYEYKSGYFYKNGNTYYIKDATQELPANKYTSLGVLSTVPSFLERDGSNVDTIVSPNGGTLKYERYRIKDETYLNLYKKSDGRILQSLYK